MKAGRHFTESWMRSQTGASKAITGFTYIYIYGDMQLFVGSAIDKKATSDRSH